MSAKQKKITVLLEQEEFDEFDDFCRANGFKKSTLLVRLLKEFLKHEASTKEHEKTMYEKRAKSRL